MKMESFLLGDYGPEVFYDVQKTVLQSLEEKYYSPFLSSVQYQELIIALNNEESKEMAIRIFPDNPDEHTLNNECESPVDLSNHSTYARTKLDQLQVCRSLEFLYNVIYNSYFICRKNLTIKITLCVL